MKESFIKKEVAVPVQSSPMAAVGSSPKHERQDLHLYYLINLPVYQLELYESHLHFFLCSIDYSIFISIIFYMLRDHIYIPNLYGKFYQAMNRLLVRVSRHSYEKLNGTVS